MIDLFPEEVMGRLKQQSGKALDRLTHTEDVAFALAANEGSIVHTEPVCPVHGLRSFE